MRFPWSAECRNIRDRLDALPSNEALNGLDALEAQRGALELLRGLAERASAREGTDAARALAAEVRDLLRDVRIGLRAARAEAGLSPSTGKAKAKAPAFKPSTPAERAAAKARHMHNVTVALRGLEAGAALLPLAGKVPMAACFPQLDSDVTPEARAAAVAKAKASGREPYAIGSTRKPATLRAWPPVNGELAFGISPGLIGALVVDCDDLDGEAFGAFLAQHGEALDLSRVPVTASGRGGLHYWFANPDGIGCGKLKTLCADLKGVGGQVVAPGMMLPPKVDEGGRPIGDARHYQPLPGSLDLWEALASGTLPALPKSLARLIAERPATSTGSASTAEIQAAADALAAGPQPGTPERDVEAMAEALRAEDPDFGELWDNGDPDGDRSARRFACARRMLERYSVPSFSVLDYRELMGVWEHSGDFRDYDLSREYAKHVNPITLGGSAEGFGVADLDDEPAPDRFAEARATLACEHQFGTPATIRAAHDALVVAAYAVGKADLAKRLDAMSTADRATAGAAETVVEAQPAKVKRKRGIILPTAAPARDLHEIPATDWLVWPMYARRVVGTLIGPAGVAKSRLALTEVLAIVAGRPEVAGWAPGSIVRRVSAWYHCQEDDLDQIELRLAALRKHHGIPKSAIDGSEGFTLHRTSGTVEPLTLAWRDPETKAAKVNPDLGDIVTFIKEHRIGLVAVDPATELHELEENNAGDMRVVWGAARTIAEKTFAHVLVISHSRKPDGASNEGHAGDMNTLRGSSAAVGVVRCARTVFTMSEKDAGHFKVDPARRHAFLRLDDAKNNLAPMRYGPQWFHRTSVDRDGLDRNRVGVVLPADLSARTSAEVRGAAAALRERFADVLCGELKAGQAIALPSVLAAAPDLAEAAGEDMSNRSRWFSRTAL